MHLPDLPPGVVQRIDAQEPFSFRCHPGVPCFTRCCHELELGITPYDVLRLRWATGLSSGEVLERFVIVEQSDAEPFPRLYLTMIDDGSASCVFLGPEGCTVYPHRPSACRTYPLGRATTKVGDRLEDSYVLLKEPHCQGFGDLLLNTPQSYLKSQDLAVYHQFNDRLADIIQHEQIRQGMKLTEQQTQTFLLALYDLDSFRAQLMDGTIDCVITPDPAVYHDDEALLRYALRWLSCTLFSDGTG